MLATTFLRWICSNRCDMLCTGRRPELELRWSWPTSLHCIPSSLFSPTTSLSYLKAIIWYSWLGLSRKGKLKPASSDVSGPIFSSCTSLLSFEGFHREERTRSADSCWRMAERVLKSWSEIIFVYFTDLEGQRASTIGFETEFLCSVECLRIEAWIKNSFNDNWIHNAY